MCDQTEVIYSKGDVVWVKLGNVWWPGQVQDYDSLPEEITNNLRKKPIAVIKFFQEDKFEYVKNLNHIYQYNCRKKEEFIKKGLDMVRSANTRDVPSHMKMFPEDIVMAEHLTGGDPNILNDNRFVPEEKANYTDLFGTKKPSKKIKSEFRREHESWKPRSCSPIKSGRRSLPATIPRPITHPRFLTKALEGKSDHEVRIRCQISVRDEFEDPPPEKSYNCHVCGFQTSRLNVIVLHNKSHSASFIEAQNARRASLKSRQKDYNSPSCSFKEQTPKAVTSRGRVKSVPKKLMDYSEEPPTKIFKDKVYSKSSSNEGKSQSPSISSLKSPNKTPKSIKTEVEKSPFKRPLFGKRKSAKEKAELVAKQKQENEAMKETLLKDWDDDELLQEEVQLEKLKQALESTTQLEDINNTENDSSIVINENAPIDAITETSFVNETANTSENDTAKKDPNIDIKTKVFEFDDSEDSLPVTNFRLKNQREKFTDDKFKKPKPPKPLTKIITKPKSTAPPLFTPLHQVESDKEEEELNKAFDSLLEETSVPILPEIPKTSLSNVTPFGQISDQTSDISSSTDLLDKATERMNTNECEFEMENNKLDSELNDSNFKIECTSSGSEEQLSDLTRPSDKENTQCHEEHLDVVTASEPGVGIVCDSLLLGAEPTNTLNLKPMSLNIPQNETKHFKEECSTTEISSTCDISKSYYEEHGINAFDNENVTLQMECSDVTDILQKPNCNEVFLEGNCNNMTNSNDNIQETTEIKADKSQSEIYVLQKEVHPLGESQETFETPTSHIFTHDTQLLTEYQQEAAEIHMDKSESACEKNADTSTDENLHTIVISNDTKAQTFGAPSSDSPQEVVIDSDKVDVLEKVEISNAVEQNVENTILEDEIKKDPEIKEEATSMPITDSIDNIPSENMTGIHLTELGNTVTTTDIKTSDTTTSVEYEVAQLSEEGQRKNISSSLQDMELDINSMPVIIGGEDFIQAEQPKQPFVPIQPNYSEGIAICPKVTQSPKKSESVDMPVVEPSTSNQQTQPLPSVPKKNTKSAGRGSRSQKSGTKAIKIPTATLKNLGTIQKGGNQSVFILKTASSGHGKSDKAALQKHKGQLNMIQHGNNILIVDNSSMGGQNKIKLNPMQQQLLAGGKLAPGTRVITSKVIATTTAQGTEGRSKMSITKSPSKQTQKLFINKGDLLSTTSTNNVIINRKMVSSVVPASMVTSNKGQTIIAHKLISGKKGSIILPNSSQTTTSTGKTTTIIPSKTLIGNKSMIVTPITSKSGTFVSGNQKYRIVSSSGASISGNKLLVQNAQGKIMMDPQHKGPQVKFISGLRGQTTGNTILIQTSQGFIAKSVSPSSITTSNTATRTIMTTIPTQAKIQTPSAQPQVLQLTGIQQPASVKKVSVQKVQKVKQSPNILQKPPRKTTPRTPKCTVSSHLVSPTLPLPEQIMLSPTTSMPSSSQTTLVQESVPQSLDRLVYLTVDESGNYRQIDNKSMVSFEGSTAAPQTIFIPSDSQAATQDMGNIFLAFDDAGNVVNLSQPVTSSTITHASPAPSQDILAKALANTQVLQQETIIPDMDINAALASSSMDPTILPSSFTEQTNYPAPSLSHSVLETSLTLNQPIMTPLEVPSSVTPNVGQISNLTSNFMSSNLLTKQNQNRSSMPLLNEESLGNRSGNETVYLLDGSNIIPTSSGSQISFQLTLNDNNVIMTSGADSSSYQLVSDNILVGRNLEASKSGSGEKDITYNILPQEEEIPPAEGQTVILEEGLTEVSVKTDQFLNDVKTHDEVVSGSGNVVEQNYPSDNPNLAGSHSELYTSQMNDNLESDKEIECFNRTLGAESTLITSTAYAECGSKRMRLDER